MKKKWIRLTAFFLSVMMVMTCLPLSAFAADGGTGSADTQTSLTPAQAAADGKIVNYFGFNVGSRYWESTRTPCALHLYQPASGGADATTDTPLVLDSDGIDNGAAYVIIANPDSPTANMGVLHRTNDATDQGKGTDLTATVTHRTHLFVFEASEGGWSIRAVDTDPAKYLSLDAAPSNQRAFKTEKTIFYITPATESGTYYIWTATEPVIEEILPPVQPKCYEYKLDSDGIDSGETYAIYTNVSPNAYNRILYHTGDGNTNHVQSANPSSELTDNILPLSTGFDASRQTWTITAVDGMANGYTVRSVDSGRYLDLSIASDSGSNTSADPVTLTITSAEDGTITISKGSNNLCFSRDNGNFSVGTGTAASLRLFKKTEAPLPMAQTEFKGASNKPMDRLHILNQNDDVDTDYRIPALVTLDNGWIVAACDIRWTSTQDSPNNLDTIVSVSKDGGATWDWEIVNYFSDFAPIYGGNQRFYSASFIDPALLVSNDGTLWMAVDLQPTYVNLGRNAQKTGSGFDENGLLMVAPISESEWETKVNTSLGRDEATRLDYQAYYEYRVDINSVDHTTDKTTTKNGKTVSLYPVFHKDTKADTGYYVDAFFDLYYDYGEDGIGPVLVAQKESSDFIQANLFYIQSPWKAYSTTYLMIRKATVNQATGKLDWGDPQLISGVKNFDGETFLAFCPGRGTSIQIAGEDGEPVERIIFPVYDNVSSERASAVYTDDGGATWHRGARVENGETASNSESQIVELHKADGTSFLRMFSRNSTANMYVGYADSFNNGLTWTTTKYDRNMPNGYGTMMSFINLEGCLVSPEGDVHDNLVLASYPRGSASNRRSNGIVRIGYYDTETEAMVWLNDKDAIRYPYRFTYSCLTQLRDRGHFTDRVALLYEDERTWAANHGMEMGFDTFSVTDLLGTGWSWRLTQEGDEPPPVDYSTLEPAQIRFTGSGSDEPMDNTDVGASFFRVPAITTLSNGWLVAAADVRWNNWRDCQNQEVMVSVSKDGATWDWDIIDYFGDLANSVDSNAGAHYIDPTLVQGTDGTVYLLADVFPAGISDISNNIAAGTGFDSQGRLLLYKGAAGSPTSSNVSDYTYYVDLNGAGDYHPICAADGDVEQGVYADAEMNLFTRNESGAYVPVLCQQSGSEKSIQNNLFFLQSEWKAFPTMFISLRTATVGQNGLEWSKLRLLNVKNAGETFLGVCPGRGFVADNGRIIFPVYDNITGPERASVIYSDDNGATWTRGGRTDNFSTNINKTSESQIIRLPDGTLRMYSRNQGSTYVGYSDSTNNGATWGTTYADTGLRTGSNCMFSVINVAGVLKGPNGESYENVVMASYPEGRGAWSDWDNRLNGCLRIGHITGSTEDGWTVNWLGEPYSYSSGQFSYSCLTQYADENGQPIDKFGALYEPGHEGTVNVRYGAYTAADVLGAGWTIHKHTEDNGTVTQEATCTEAGVKTFNCSICGDILRVEAIPATGHTELAVESIAPTCTETGLTAGTKCSVCGRILTGQEIIPAAGHTMVIDPAVPATETSTGLTEGSHCSVCETVLVAQKTIPMLEPAPTPSTPVGSGGTWMPAGPSTPDTSTTTTTNPDGSTTTTVTDSKTGTVTETTKKEDGTVEVVETRKDGTVTETTTDPGGGKVEKVVDPNKDVTITATNPEGEVLAKVEIPAEIPALDADKQFTDVPDNHYAADAINNMAALGVVNGVGNQQFNRDGEMKRGDLAVILYRMSNGSDSYELKFDDVSENRYYANGVAWAAETGVVTGYSENTFGPEDTITREQLALMLYRYAALLGLDTTASADALNAFTDGANTHTWAADGMAWCVENGILQGRGSGILDPGTNVIRADVAVMLQRFMNLLK